MSGGVVGHGGSASLVAVPGLLEHPPEESEDGVVGLRRFHGMLAREMEKQRVSAHGGPRDPQPFKDGSLTKLITCPHCKLKHLPMYNAPNDVVYRSTCQSCGSVQVFHPKGMSVKEAIQGQSLFEDGLVERVHVGKEVVLNAERLAEQHLSLLDVGRRRAVRLGDVAGPGQSNRREYQ